MVVAERECVVSAAGEIGDGSVFEKLERPRCLDIVERVVAELAFVEMRAASAPGEKNAVFGKSERVEIAAPDFEDIDFVESGKRRGFGVSVSEFFVQSSAPAPDFPVFEKTECMIIPACDLRNGRSLDSGKRVGLDMLTTERWLRPSFWCKVEPKR